MAELLQKCTIQHKGKALFFEQNNPDARKPSAELVRLEHGAWSIE